ncbi:MAG: hypothetical protein ABR566_08845 [Pyrinomonadaceae bacterium]
MSEKLEVSFNSPQCGWMSIGFNDGANEFHTTTAHAPHEKALSELLRILSNLLDENLAENEYILHWNRNPEEFDFHFFRQGEILRLEIYQYPSETRQTAEREMVFAHTGKTKDVCAAFHATFAQLYKDKDTDEFEFNWRQDFPLEEFERFSRLAAK